MNITQEEQRPVYEVALRIRREISDWDAAGLDAVKKYKGDAYHGGPRAKEMRALYQWYRHDNCTDEPTQHAHALWSIQRRLVADFEQVFWQWRFEQATEAARLDLAAKISALKENCERVMKVIEETQDSNMLFMLRIQGLADILKPAQSAESAA